MTQDRQVWIEAERARVRALPTATMDHPGYGRRQVYIHSWDRTTVCVSAEPYPLQTFWVSRDRIGLLTDR